MDIDSLLQPISPELPCGPDIDDHDQENHQDLLESFVHFKSILDGELDKNGVKQPPRWGEIQSQAIKLAHSCKHLFLAQCIAKAGLETGGIEGFAEGLRLIQGWVSDFWKDLYPRDERGQPLNELSRGTFLVKVKRAKLSKTAAGAFSYEDYEKALKDQQSADTDTASNARVVLGSFRDTPRELLQQRLATLKKAHDAAAAIEKSADAQDTRRDVSLKNLRDVLSAMVEVIEPLAADPVPAGTAGTPGQAGDKAAGTAASPGSPAASAPMGGQVASRAQAKEQLERIARYFEQSEPSSPVPYMLRRAILCIGKNFMELIDELAVTKEQATQVLHSPNAGSEEIEKTANT